MTSAIVFERVRIFDGSGQLPFAGEVRVDGNRITHLACAGEHIPKQDARIIDGKQGVLTPGLVEAHAHLTRASCSITASRALTPPAHSASR